MSLSFDATFYQNSRPDVYNAFIATAGSTGLTWAQFAEQHYDTFGRFEGSDPSASFDTSYYLNTYPDVAAAGINPFTHFLQFGSLEDRVPFVNFPNIASGNFVPATYAAANPDLAAAGITSNEALYQHFVVFGQFEGRSGAPTVNTPNTSTGTTQNFTTTVGETLTGTDGDDTFSGTADAAGLGATPQATVNTGDTADGAGGTDTANIVATSAGASVAAGVLSNIEIVNLTSDTGGDGFTAATVNSANFAGVTQLWQIGGTASVDATVASGVTAGFNATALASGAGSVVAAASTSSVGVNVALVNVATGGTLEINETTAGSVTSATVSGSVAGAGALTIDLDTAGGTGTATTALATLNLGLSTTGTITLVDAVGPVMTTIDASASTGGLTFAGVPTSVTTFTGGTGADSFTATAAGATTISGGAGNDTLGAGAGGSTITGGTGLDVMTAAGGTDTFIINSGDSGLTAATVDQIVAFTTTTDKLDFNLTAGSATNFLNGGASSSLTDGLTNANTAMNGTVQYFDTQVGANTFVFVDADLDGTADFAVQLTGVGAIAFGDIIA
ncbi:beta strand repeat-containing protein [Roseibium album]|uniref:beta strand repeat-containing protein n=1 Tax=Roseibium album TaxID=311410 RepID=UPI00391AA88C